MSRMIKIIATLVLSLLLVVQGESVLAAGKKSRAPVTMIMNVEGTVEYSKNGTKWKKVRRNKFLFPGYMIRTGADGKGTFLNQESNLSRDMSGDSEVTITAAGAEATKGALSEPVAGSGDLVASLGNRFKKGQKYTTVRRGLKIKLGSASHSKSSPYKLSAAWPELIWDNVLENDVVKQGSKITDENYSEFSYRLTIDKQTVEVPAPKGELAVRFALKDMLPGKHKYKVELLRNGEMVSEKVRRASSFIWIDAAEESAIKGRLASRGGDELLEAISLDNDGIKVGALDIYTKFFAENLDEVDMRPQMLEHIRGLKLGELLSHEGTLYEKLLAEEG